MGAERQIQHIPARDFSAITNVHRGGDGGIAAPEIGERLHGKFTGAFDSLNEWDLSQCGQTIQKVFRRYGNRNPG
jgi:hypothetical protein